MKGTLKWLIVFILTVTVYGNSMTASSDATVVAQQSIVTEALEASITAERIGRYALYPLYEIDTTESRVDLTTAVSMLGLSLKELSAALHGTDAAKNLPWIESSYTDLVALLHTEYQRDELILIEDYVTLISQGMLKIAADYEREMAGLERYHLVIDLERSLRLYMIYQTEALKYEYMEEVLCDTIARLDERIAQIGEVWGQEDSRFVQLDNEWHDIEEIYDDRDEGELIPEAIERSEYLTTSI